jgi:hypothetical protein
MLRLLTLIAIFIITVFLLSGCGNRQSSRITLLYDRSNSITQDLRKSYLVDTEFVLNKVCGGDYVKWSIITDALDAEDISNNVSLMKPTFINFSSSENDKKLKDNREQIIKRIEEFLNKPDVNGTCIVDSLRLAEEKFKQYPNDRKIIVIFSDMLEWCNGVDFEKNFSQEFNEIVNKMKKNAPLPNLEGIEVYIVSKATKSKSSKYYAIKEFWENFFKETKATLIQYDTEMNFRPNDKCPENIYEVITGK